MILSFLIFMLVVHHDYENFSSGYLGRKLKVSSQKSFEFLVTRTIQNTIKVGGMLHKEGDKVFRWNVVKSPQIDKISGIFFIFGMIYILFVKKKNRLYILLPLFLLPIPSLLPTIPSLEIPNSSRTMIIIPFVFYFVAEGIDLSYRCLTVYLQKKICISIIAIFLLSIMYLNVFQYFYVYPGGLPFHNAGLGSSITRYLDDLPIGTQVIVYQDPKNGENLPLFDSVYYSPTYQMKKKDLASIWYLYSCKQFHKGQVILINPRNYSSLGFFINCFPQSSINTYNLSKRQAFTSIILKD